MVNIPKPTEENQLQIKDNFFEQLKEGTNNLSQQNMYIILEYFIAKVGYEAEYKPNSIFNISQPANINDVRTQEYP